MYIEPSADKTQVAAETRQMFNALTAAGFTEAQAMQMICAIIQRKNDG